MVLNFVAPTPETKRRLLAAFPEYKDGFVRCTSNNLLMPVLFKKYSDNYSQFHLRVTDTFILSFPKSGTTWTQEMVWLVANDCNYEGAKVLLRERVPFLEDPAIATEEALKMWFELSKKNEQVNGSMDAFIESNYIDALPSPRFIKSHLPLSCLPPNLLDECKVVYVARNPKDVAVSWFFHHQMDPIMETALDFESFVKFFMKNEVLYAPYWNNVLEAWKKRDHPNLLFLFYEDMKKDLPSQLQRVAFFFGKSLSPKQIEELSCHLSFEQFKNNPAVNAQELRDIGYFKKDCDFIRKGESGGWKKYFSSELSNLFDEWITENLKGTGLIFPEYCSV